MATARRGHAAALCRGPEAPFARARTAGAAGPPARSPRAPRCFRMFRLQRRRVASPAPRAIRDPRRPRRYPRIHEKNRGLPRGADRAARPDQVPLQAAETAPRCAQILDDGPRLACYDARFGKPVPPVAPPVQVAVAPKSAPSSTPSPSPPPSPAAKSRDEIMTARIVRVSRVSNDRFQVTLDSGEIWTQLERDSNAEVSVGDSVKIRPALLGSWMLETRAGVRTPRAPGTLASAVRRGVGRGFRVPSASVGKPHHVRRAWRMAHFFVPNPMNFKELCAISTLGVR